MAAFHSSQRSHFRISCRQLLTALLHSPRWCGVMLSTEPANWARHRSDGRFVATLFAVVAPLNLAFNVPPSATVLNQATAWLGWGAAVMALLLGRANVAEAGMPSGVRPITGVLVLVIGAALTSVAWTGLPWSLALSAAGTASAGLVIALAGARCTTAGFAADADGGAMTGALCWGLAVAGSIASLIALIQTYVPAWADGDWIALPSGSRVGANLRQPNHLATLLLWSAIALVWLGQRLVGGLPQSPWPRCSRRVVRRRAHGSRTGVAACCCSRPGARSMGSVPRRWRQLLVAAPLLYGLFWWLLSVLPSEAPASAAGVDRLHLGSSRWAVWTDTLNLLRQAPWSGVGFGEFNFAWTLTPFRRAGEFFDHTHNLPLQLAVELGCRWAARLALLLAIGLARAWQARRRRRGHEVISRRGLMMLLLMAGCTACSSTRCGTRTSCSRRHSAGACARRTPAARRCSRTARPCAQRSSARSRSALAAC